MRAPATADFEFRNGYVLKTVDFSRATTKLVNTFLQPYYPNSDIEPIIAHEVKALEMLTGYNISPAIRNYGNDFIEMSYAGENIEGNLPSDQIDYIIQVLQKVGIEHNDIAYAGELRNCTWLKGKLYLIDFQLASINGTPHADVIWATFWRPDYVSDEYQLRLRGDHINVR